MAWHALKGPLGSIRIPQLELLLAWLSKAGGQFGRSPRLGSASSSSSAARTLRLEWNGMETNELAGLEQELGRWQEGEGGLLETDVQAQLLKGDFTSHVETGICCARGWRNWRPAQPAPDGQQEAASKHHFLTFTHYRCPKYSVRCRKLRLDWISPFWVHLAQPCPFSLAAAAATALQGLFQAKRSIVSPATSEPSYLEMPGI